MNHRMNEGRALPEVRTDVPGPSSRALGRRLAAVESPNITMIGETGPIFWAEAAGSNVMDVDGNVYVDLTAGFGVAAAGHANPAVARAIGAQTARLPHALGDVHPSDIKVELLERLAALAPGDLSLSILASDGSDAVEAAWKTATLATGRPGALAFHGGYHGLGMGALALTAAARFREPFRRQLYGGVRFAPFPHRGGPGTAAALDEARRLIQEQEGGADAVGAVFVEPVQGRGGIIVPPPDFLPGLRALCTELDVLLVIDEVYTGFGRTGRWFGCQHWDVAPDILVVGKSLAGGLPLSAAIAPPAVMSAWPPSEGEAIHTSTFLGNPVACAAALAHLRVIEEQDLVGRAAALGEVVRERAAALDGVGVAGSRGLGLMQALVLEGPADEAARRAMAVAETALRRGVIVLSEGQALAITPPLVITRPQLEAALDVIAAALAEIP